MRRAEGRKRQAAVAVEDGRQALPQLGMAEAFAEHLRVAVAVNVQKSRRDAEAGHVQRLRRRAKVVPDRGNSSAGNGEVGRDALAAAAVEKQAAFQDQIKHITFLPRLS